MADEKEVMEALKDYHKKIQEKWDATEKKLDKIKPHHAGKDHLKDFGYPQLSSHEQVQRYLKTIKILYAAAQDRDLYTVANHGLQCVLQCGMKFLKDYEKKHLDFALEWNKIKIGCDYQTVHQPENVK